MKKRGEAIISKTNSISALVLLIFFFLIGYLLLLPSAERAELLDIDLSEGDEGYEGDVESILVKSPGYLNPIGSEKQEKEIGSLSLYSTMEKESDKLANNIYVSRNILSSNSQDLNFKLEDVSDLQNLGVFFNVVESKGDLIILLDDNMVYKGKGASFDLPIDLPLSILKYNNKLSFVASSPGINIFGKNYYELKDISLIRTDKFVNKEEIRRFSIDKDNLKADVDLEFYVNCLKVGKQQGILEVSLNEKNIFTGRLSCYTGKTKIDIRKEFVKDGENVLKFEIDRGDYRFEDVNLVYYTKKGENPLYYFGVDDEDVYKEFELRLIFGRGDIKRATFFVNGEEFSMVSEDDDWYEDISDYIKEGENYIKVIPKNEFEVTHLEIVLIE